MISDRSRTDLGLISDCSWQVIFAEQGLTLHGQPGLGPGVQLFGHACADGGVILRPELNKIFCGTGTDCGANCCNGMRHVCPATEVRVP